jgi:hypothetical protein
MTKSTVNIVLGLGFVFSMVLGFFCVYHQFNAATFTFALAAVICALAYLINKVYAVPARAISTQVSNFRTGVFWVVMLGSIGVAVSYVHSLHLR